MRFYFTTSVARTKAIWRAGWTDLLESLRANLFRWRELFPAYCKAVEEGQQAYLDAGRILSGNAILPDGADDPIRTAHLGAAMRRGERAVVTIKEYEALTESIRGQSPVVASAAQKAGIDSAPLSLFSTDPNEDRWEAALAVVDRLSALGPESIPKERRQRIPPNRRTIPMTLKDAAKLLGYANHRKVKDAVELLSKSIRDGIITAEEQNRQRFIFDRNDFPQESHPKIIPGTKRNSP